MKTKKIKLISSVLAAAAVLSAGSVFAEPANETKAAGTGETVSPYFIAITSYDNVFDISSGTATCYGYTSVRSGYIARVIVELQKLNGDWETIETWTQYGPSITAQVDEEYDLEKGTYRLKTTHQAFKGIDTAETYTVYSDEMSY